MDQLYVLVHTGSTSLATSLPHCDPNNTSHMTHKISLYTRSIYMYMYVYTVCAKHSHVCQCFCQLHIHASSCIHAWQLKSLAILMKMTVKLCLSVYVRSRKELCQLRCKQTYTDYCCIENVIFVTPAARARGVRVVVWVMMPH